VLSREAADFFLNVRIRALIAKAPRGKTGGAETFQLLRASNAYQRRSRLHWRRRLRSSCLASSPNRPWSQGCCRLGGFEPGFPFALGHDALVVSSAAKDWQRFLAIVHAFPKIFLNRPGADAA
jgi:hypothetical protein